MYIYKKVVLSISLVAFIMVISFAITYSYFTVVTDQSTSVITATAAKLTIDFLDHTPDIVFSDVVPGPIANTSDAILDKSFTISGVNTSSELLLNYNLKLVVDNNEFENGSLAVALVGTVNNGSIVSGAYFTYDSNNLVYLDSSILDDEDNAIPFEVDFGNGYFDGFVNGREHQYHFYTFYVETGLPQNDSGCSFSGKLVLTSLEVDRKD